MHVLYEDDGGFKAATILSETDASLQVEATSGKRSKIKKSAVIVRFEQPSPEALLKQAEEASQELDLEFLWECAPKDDFDIPVLAEEYYGHPPTPVEQASMLLRVHGAPVYFHRRGKGKYRPAPPDILAAALAALEKKKRQAEQQQAWVDEIKAGALPEPLARQAETLLFKPDKNTLEWKALDAACTQLQMRPERLLMNLGAFPSALSIHKRRFYVQHFPRGTGFAPVEVPPVGRDLPMADVEAYSIDDITTTEIDDALSVQPLDDGTLRVGIHIAAPGLAVTRDSGLDAIARARMSTVYMPGDKIPMQPDEVIASFSLDAGRPVPAVSLYVVADPETGEILSHESRIERIVVRENLRHNVLDERVDEASLADPNAELPYGHVFRPLWRLAQALSAKRDAVRGKPESNNRIDFSFYVDGDPDHPEQATVRIEQRKRNAPLDRLVAEYMILANSVWGGLLASCGVPGIYRSQQMGRVRMGTAAAPHDSIGVPQYAWCTSPLRRYVDLVNQGQLIAAIDHGVSARLVAPFKPREADLYAIISAFEAKYGAYADFQQSMERFWCLRWLKQQGLRRVEAVVLREDLVRLKDAPFYTRVGTLPALERGRHVMLEIMGDDELDLTLDCRFVDVVEAADQGEEIEDEPPAEAQVEVAETDAADGPDPSDLPLDAPTEPDTGKDQEPKT
ncbi:MAG: RNB domain-containing ribonuclease [Pigmentiphaga sp.]|uniref:ribonuclease catalytic domain-containing protein n=1 Tax=Pigmentiphaga sp. TaxID=1977564 RepID=UPI0029B6E2F2|nr:ribonuclease catalytic domain-containing protein [Pigmentiphaga sp.]MDX3904932.1 RNB domain-containing ribonuclease [Pigmentiphaga sp.]